MTALGAGSQFVQDLWQMSATSPHANPTSRPTTRLEQIDQLLRQIQDATLAVRRLLQVEGRDTSFRAGERVLADTEASTSPPTVALVQRNAEGGEGDTHRADSAAINWDLVTRSLIRERFAAIGHVGAGVLLRLLCSPGEFVTREELAQAAGVRSASNRVIKVYICRLRHALMREGALPAIIETGRRSYRLQHMAVPQIMALLTVTQAAAMGNRCALRPA